MGAWGLVLQGRRTEEGRQDLSELPQQASGGGGGLDGPKMLRRILTGWGWGWVTLSESNKAEAWKGSEKKVSES